MGTLVPISDIYSSKYALSLNRTMYVCVCVHACVCVHVCLSTHFVKVKYKLSKHFSIKTKRVYALEKCRKL